MPEIRFEWDEKKHALNKRKHGVSFDEAQTIFADENGLLLDDPDHSHDEDRFILLGLSFRPQASGRFPYVPERRGDHKNYLSPQSNTLRAKTILEQVVAMRKQYDFSKATKNPYSSLLKKQVTIRLDEGTVKYFKELAKDAGIPYQTLINLYLRDCAASGRKLTMEWKKAS